MVTLWIAQIAHQFCLCKALSDELSNRSQFACPDCDIQEFWDCLRIRFRNTVAAVIALGALDVSQGYLFISRDHTLAQYPFRYCNIRR